MRLKRNKNYQELQTVRKVVRIKSAGIKFVNGISNRYDGAFPHQIEGLINREKYEIYMSQLNRKVNQYWPCCFAYYCGYLCIPCTLGLSLCIPRICIADAEKVLLKEIQKINAEVLGNSKLEMRLVKECDDSYLLIEERDFTEFELCDENLTSL